MRQDIGLIKIGKYQFLITSDQGSFRALIMVMSSGSSNYIDTIYSEFLEDLPFKALDYAIENNTLGTLYLKVGAQWF